MKIRITFDLNDEQRKAISYEHDGGYNDKGYIIYKADYESCRQTIIEAVDYDLSALVEQLVELRMYKTVEE